MKASPLSDAKSMVHDDGTGTEYVAVSSYDGDTEQDEVLSCKLSECEFVHQVHA